MMKPIKYFLVFFSLTLCACGLLRPATHIQNEDLTKYKYVYIPYRANVTSATGTFYHGTGGVTNKSINPGDLIAGHFIKHGYAILPELNPTLLTETLIVNYGESGRRKIMLGLVNPIEMTIQLLSAATNQVVYSVTAEGIGETESDDVRNAINSCLQNLPLK